MTYTPVNRHCFNHAGNLKKIYATQTSADRDAKRMNERPRPGKRFYYSYPCDPCGGWHIGGRET